MQQTIRNAMGIQRDMPAHSAMGSVRRRLLTSSSPPAAPSPTCCPGHWHPAAVTCTRLAEPAKWCVSASVAIPSHATLRTHRYSTHSANLEMWYDRPDVRCNLVDRLGESWRLYLVVSHLDWLAGSLQQPFVELVVWSRLPEHQLQILINILRGKWGRCRC